MIQFLIRFSAGKCVPLGKRLNKSEDVSANVQRLQSTPLQIVFFFMVFVMIATKIPKIIDRAKALVTF